MDSFDFEGVGILNLPAEYVDQCQALEFTEDPNFLLDLTGSANQNIKALIANINQLKNMQNLWNLINKEGINSQTFQVWIFYHLHHGHTPDANFDEKQRAIYAAHIYFLLLTQPGSGGNQFHHPVLFENALNTFKIACTISSQARSKKTKSTQQMGDNLTVNQEVILLDDFAELLKTFSLVVKSYPLKNHQNELKQSVEAFVLVIKSFASTMQVTDTGDGAFIPPSQQSLNGLRSIIEAKHGNIKELSTLVFRLLMTTITMRHALSSGATLPRWAIKQAEAAVNLISAVCHDHGELVSQPIWRLCQNLIAQCPDRAENRTQVSSFVMRIISKMPVAWYANFIDWLKRFVTHSKSYRSGGLSLISSIITQPERSFSEEDHLTDEQKANLSHKQLLQVVISSITDVYPTIRAKALLVLATALETVSPAVFLELFQGESNLTSPNREKRISSVDGVTPLEATDDRPLFTPAALNSVPVPSFCNVQLLESNLFSLLSNRAYEEKYMVRKSAVLALEVAICFGYVPATKETLAILEERCRDSLLSIRKAAIQSLTNVLTKYPDNINVQYAWMTCLLPSVMDAETSMQEKAVQLIEAKLLSNLDQKENSVWNLLMFLTTDKLRQNRIYLEKVTKEWYNQGKLKTNILNVILNGLTEEKNKVQCWMLLCMITLYTGNKAVASTTVQQWKTESDVNIPICLQMDMVSTLGHVAKYMSDEDKSKVLERFSKEVESGNCPIQLIGYYFEAMYQIFQSQLPNRAACQASMGSWCSKLLSACENALSNVVITQTQQHNLNQDRLINDLYVVGEAAQRCHQVPKRLKLSIQALLTDPSTADKDLPSQPLSQFGTDGIPPAIRAHAIFNLGRMCFQDDTLAKKCTPALARELESCADEDCRNNALVILTDLCVLQTQLVDPFFKEMTNCLGDSSVTIRKQAVILISSLLQREYVKWKDALLFKYLFVACDDCSEVRSLARHLLLDQLLRGIQASGSLFYRNFVACLFYFNCYDSHSVNKHMKTPREKKYFDLSQNFAKRMEIYEFMLMNMEDEHRINLTGKLCADVLESFVEDSIPLNSQTENLLTDTLTVLCCKEIRLRCIRSRDENEIEDEMGVDNPDEQLRVMQNAARHKLILQTVKLNLVENIIPIIIALKNMLTELKSPLVKNVMLYLKEVMKEYRKEVNVILSADKQLASEIEFDLKRFEREQENAQVAAVQPLALVPDAQVPSKDLPSAKTPVPGTPGSAATNRFNFVTPATARRKKRPLNVDAILKSAQKVISESPRPKTPAHTSSLETDERAEVPPTPQNSQQALRAASTPQTATDNNVTFAARDISAIIGPGRRETMLMLSLRKNAPPKTWNISSPSRCSLRRTKQVHRNLMNQTP